MSKLSNLILIITVFLIEIPQLEAQRRVACIGDSVTKGYGIKDSTQTYPYQLQQLLGVDFKVGNFGHSGATLLRKGHNPYVQTQAYRDALKFKPDVIVIALGLNDTDPRNWPNYSDEFVGDYSALVEDFRHVNPNVEVFICTMTPIFSGHPRFLSGTRAWFSKAQAAIKELTAVNEAVLIDNHTALASRIDLFGDFLHPNARGAEILAQNVAQYLKPVVQPLSVEETLGSHMVLQRGVINTLAGKASAKEKITVRFKGKTYTTLSDVKGNWTLELPTQDAGGPYDIEVATVAAKLTLKDILFGDVFLASGQSNMAFPLRMASGADSILGQMHKLDKIRIFKNKVLAETNSIAWDQTILHQLNELKYFSGAWEKSSTASISDFSAVAYATAVELYKSQGVPIGIIDISVGGSNIESWIPRSVLEQDNLLASYIHTWRTSDIIQDFCRQRAAKNLEHAQLKHQRHPYDPAYNFEAGIAKWTSTKIKGIIWYQGESSAHNIEHHTYLFPVMVKSWRDAFQQQLPFYFVQLSSINRPSWPAFRDSQRLLTNVVSDVHMAVSSDIGHPTDVHPTNKLILGNRLGQLIRQHTYNELLVADSPQPVDFRWDKDRLVISFNHCQILQTVKDLPIKDLQYVNSKGEILDVQHGIIHENTLILPLAKDVKYVRYAYTPYTEGNLISDTHIPVSTFILKID